MLKLCSIIGYCLCHGDNHPVIVSKP